MKSEYDLSKMKSRKNPYAPKGALTGEEIGNKLLQSVREMKQSQAKRKRDE